MAVFAAECHKGEAKQEMTGILATAKEMTMDAAVAAV